VLNVAVSLHPMSARQVSKPRAEGTAASSRRWRAWDDDADRTEPLTRAQAEELRRREPSLSPWKVIGAQAVLGVLMAAVAWALFGAVAAISALYGAAVAVLPGALMARGATSPLARLSPAAGAVSIMLWSLVKIGATVLLLVLAPRLVQPLHWPALLIALVACLQVYWFALLVRGHPKNNAAHH
jgi:ATP synthase protein I